MFSKSLFIHPKSSLLVFVLLLAFPFTNKANPYPNTAIISGEMKVWHKITLSFQGPNTYENASVNPFMDYRLNVVFTHPDTSYEVPGYYAASGNAAEDSDTSGNVWKVHFAPDRPGNWDYTVSFRTGTEVAISNLSTAGTPVSFDGETGSFYVFPTDKSYPDFRASGRVSYVGKRYWQHQGSGK
ncbi:MAG: DUF5060 domain-containing protein, partial [Bacteroidetes bacterium]|nr:DUF5060 domain-containing protein [Bacteroidota bacterium]